LGIDVSQDWREDGFGRRAVTAPSGCAAVETLIVNPDLSRVEGFRMGVAARGTALAAGGHRALARVLEVTGATAPQEKLTVRSEHVPGERLSEVLARCRLESRPLPTGQALFVIRELIGGIRALHACAPGACHGALSPSRVAVTADRRVVVRDSVFGGGLPALHWPTPKVAALLGVRLPDVPGVPAFTPLTDQFQVGLIGLALLSGRDFDDAPAAVLSAACSGSPCSDGNGLATPLPVEFGSVLARMLLVSRDGPFRSFAAIERAFEAAVATRAGLVLSPPAVRVDQAPAGDGGTQEAGPRRTREARPPAPDPAALTVVLNDDTERRTSAPAPAGRQESEVLPGASRDEPASALPAWWESHAEAGPPAAGTPPRRETAAGAVAGGPLHAEVDRQGTPAAGPTVVPPAPPPVPPESNRQGETVAPGSEASSPQQRRAPSGLREVPPFALSRTAHQGWERALHTELDFEVGGTPLVDSAGGDLRVDRLVEADPVSRPWLRVAAIALAVLGIVACGGYVALSWLGGEAKAPDPGFLRLESKPAGATVLVNGRQEGVTPLALSVTPGSYRIEFSLENETRAVTVPVTAGQESYQTVSLYPTGPPGTISVVTTPPGATVFIDGVARGRAPLSITDIVPGEHVVVVESAVARVERTVEVMAGRLATLDLPLSGHVQVTSPFEVLVFDKAKALGSTRTGRMALPAGVRQLTFANDELQYEENRDVDIPAGGVAQVVLAPPSGTLNFSADVATEVFLDDRPLGNTPLNNVQVSLGSHVVLFKHQKWGEQRYTILVSLGSPARLHATMQVRTPTIRVSRPTSPTRPARALRR
jgi:hypothetical protein